MTIADIFADAQKSATNHRSLTKRLRKIEKKTESNRSRFEDEVKQCIFRCLEVSKSEKSGQNIVKFVCTYCARVETEEAENADEDYTSITSQILIALLPFMGAKDKIVRYRATQIVSQLMGIVQQLDDDLYQAIRHELIKRIRDKIPAIRLEAVCALGRLLENEIDEEENAAQERDKDSDDDDEVMSDGEERESTGLLGKLLEVLMHDTNADVRKALLVNLPVEPRTQPYLLERARDKDAATRKAVYVKVLPRMDDFRYLPLTMREKLLRWGLRDRDDRVKMAAAKMFSISWVDQIAKTIEQTETDEQGEVNQSRKKHVGFEDTSMEALHELLERIDILNTGQEDAIGLEAMKEFWRLRPDYFDLISFDDDFWNKLDVETAFVARSFYDYCSQNPDARKKAEDRMPEVTRFGYHLQKHLRKHLTQQSDLLVLPEEEIDESEFAQQEFIVEQLLHIAHTLDYTDEIGRRKLFTLLRETIAVRCLPLEATRLAIEALRLTCTAGAAGEKEFVSVVLEALAEVQDDPNQASEDTIRPNSRGDTPADDESFVSAQSEIGSPRSDATATNHRSKSSKSHGQPNPEAAIEVEHERLILQLKCLGIAYNLLQNITCDLTTNISLDTMLNTLILPALQSHDEPIRERGLECMGLACLSSPSLAADNKNLFIHCMRKGTDEMRKTCLQTLCDCAITHREQDPTSDDNGIDLKPYVKGFQYSTEVAGVATMCVAKLMMCGFYQMGEEGTEVREVFDNVIEEAQNGSVKGWELLGKVKAALNADAVAKGLVEDGERRAS